MSDNFITSDPPDICLILRAHGEAQWLSSEIVPLVRQLEAQLVAEERIGAALAYLEVLWIDAAARAAETDAARDALDRTKHQRDRVLCEKARRYHSAVRRLRRALARRVAALTRTCEDFSPQWPICDRHASS